MILADLRLLIAAPLVGALVVLLAPSRWARWIAGVAAGLGLLAAVAVVAAEPAGLAVAWAWVPALGLSLSLGIDGLAAPGVLVICLVGQVAALAAVSSRGSRAGGLALQAVLLALVLARDLGTLVGCHALLAPLVAGLVAGGSTADRWRAGGAAGLYLALGTAALALAVGLQAVGHHDASGGSWDLSLAALAQVLLPRGLEAAVGGLLLFAGAVTLGLWPLHGWLVTAGAAAPTGAALMIAGPVRWVGAYVLMRLWMPLAAGSAAAAGPGVAVLAVLGGLVGAVCARAEPDGRRALLLATTVPAGLLVLGLAGQHHEGAVGAAVLAVVLALGGAAGLLALTAGVGRRVAGLALLPAPGLAGCVAVAMVLIGTARFSASTFGARGWLLAVAAGVMLVAAIRALADRTGRNEQGPEDMSPETGGWQVWAGVAVLVAPLVAIGVGPSPWLARLDPVGRGVVDAAMLRRCLTLELAVKTPTGVPAEFEACAQPRRVVEEAARAAAAAVDVVSTQEAGVSVEEVTLAAPLIIVGAWALLLPLAGRVLADAWARALALAGVGLAIAALATLVGRDELVAGIGLWGDVLVADRLGLLLDGTILIAALAIVAGDPRADADRHALVLLAGAGAMLCVHAGDLAVLVGGLELACLAAAVLLGREAERSGRAGFTWLIGQGLAAALLWLGLGLVFGATGTTRIGELAGRISAVFLRWGANTVQSAVDLLQSPSHLAGGLEGHARDVAVTGAAPAMLLVPGLLLALAGLLARFGVAPLQVGVAAVVGRAGMSGAATVLVLVRLAAAAALLRVFVAVVHAPRVVYAPYGWGTAVAVLAGASAVVGAIAAARQVDLRRLLGWATVANGGLALLGMVAAADFYAHAGARAGGLGVSEHVDWGQSMGDLAVAAVLLTLVMHALASLGLLAAHAAFDRGRGHVDLVGLARRAPGSAAAVAVCLLGLAGAPPTGAFVARWALLEAGLEDSNLLVRAMLGLGLLTSAALAAACVRVLVSLSAEEVSGGTSAVAGRWPRVVLAVLAAMVFGTGLIGQVSVEASQAAAKGAGLQAGGKARRALTTSAEGVR